jgi:hypothetical protein
MDGLQMDDKAQADKRYGGCKCFVSESGFSMFALGVEGDRAGWLYDVFVSPRERKPVVAALIRLAVNQGARQLVTYEHPFLEWFFLQFGFETRIRVKHSQLNNPPREWIPDSVASGFSCPDFLCMARKDDYAIGPSMMSDTEDFASRAGTVSYDQYCASCGSELPALRWLDVFGGYQCRRGCGTLHVEGALTLAPWDGDGSASIPQPGRFSSGADLLRFAKQG